MTWKIPLFKIYTDDEDLRLTNEVIASGMNWATGPKVQEFESKIASYVGTKYAVTFNSGTSALHAQMIAHGIGAGDEVIVPSFTFISTANSPFFTGAKPVFADIESKRYGLDPEDVEKHITKNTKAIIPVHIGGCACRIDELREIANNHDILLIEDAAESLGAKIDGKKVGTFGESAMFSFCGPKVITTGEGGVVVTDSREIYEKLKLTRSHGRAETKDYFSTNEFLDHITLGYNWRMSNITAALGIAQLNKIEKVISMRRKNAAYLTKKLSGISGIIPPEEPKGCHHLYQMYTIKAENRDKLMQHLSEKGVMSKIYFPLINHTKYYRDNYVGEINIPTNLKMSEIVLTLPMYPDLSKNEMDYVAECIEEFYGA